MVLYPILCLTVEPQTLRLYSLDGKSGSFRNSLSFRGHTKAVARATYGRRTRLAYSCSRDTTLRQWSRSADLAILSFEGHDLTCTALALSAGAAGRSKRVKRMGWSRNVRYHVPFLCHSLGAIQHPIACLAPHQRSCVWTIALSPNVGRYLQHDNVSAAKMARHRDRSFVCWTPRSSHVATKLVFFLKPRTFPPSSFFNL